MDLTFTEDQNEIGALADRILGDLCSAQQLRATEREMPGTWSREAWSALAGAGLVGIGLPTAVGGGGYGLCEAALVVEAVARAAAPLPAYATLVLGAPTIAAFGSVEQQNRWLPGVCDGSALVTAVLVGADDSDTPVSATRREAGGYVLQGTGWYVPYAMDATALVVPIRLDDGDRILAVVPRGAPGLGFEALAPISSEATFIVVFDGVEIDDRAVLADSANVDGAAVRWLRERAVGATCVAQAGTCAGALGLTASYVSSREQFGSKLATLQAVSQRAADAWIDTETIRLTAWSALWRLAEGLDATEELAVAKFFATEAAQRVVAAAQHLHGGIGVDLDYPVHRYFRWAKEHEQRLGGGNEHLATLGRALAGD